MVVGSSSSSMSIYTQEPRYGALLLLGCVHANYNDDILYACRDRLSPTSVV